MLFSSVVLLVLCASPVSADQPPTRDGSGLNVLVVGDSHGVPANLSDGQTASYSCCVGRRGNADCDPTDIVDIGDISAYITHLFVNPSDFCCSEEADLDFNSTIDIGDLTIALQCMFISLDPFPNCIQSGVLVSHGLCKSIGLAAAVAEPPSDQDCLEYRYGSSGVLYLSHLNAGFNCCPTELLADISIQGNIITIREEEDLSNGGCACLCLFDLEYEITGLSPGEYQINVVEPYLPGGDQELTLTVELSSGTDDIYCVDRSNYPWGDW
jgi:hypothetical protein